MSTAIPKTYGPEGGIVEVMNDYEMHEHVLMLAERMMDEEPLKQFTAGVAMSLYIGDQSFLPDHDLEEHPAAVLSRVVLRPRATKEEQKSSVRALSLMGPHAAPHAAAALGKMLASPDYELKCETMRAIRLVGPGAAEPGAGVPEALAVALLEEEQDVARYEAARALAALGPAAAAGSAEALAQSLSHHDYDVQNASAKALAAMGAAAAMPPVLEALLKAIHDGTFELKRLAAAAFASMGPAAGERAAAELAQLLRPRPSSDPVLRAGVAEALGRMGRPFVRQEMLGLAMAVKDPDERVRAAAREALQRAGCRRALKGPMYLCDPETEDEGQQEEVPRAAPALSALGRLSREEDATLLALELAERSRGAESGGASSSASSRSPSLGAPSSLEEP